MATLLDYIAESQTVASRADLYYNGSLVKEDIPISAGSVSVDSTRATRRTCTLTLAAKADELAEYMPKTPADRLAPYGAELKIRRGLNIYAHDYIYPQGWFRIATSTPTDDGNGPYIAITGYDRSRAISLAGFESTYRIAAGTDTIDAITSILAQPRFGQAIGVEVQTHTTGTVGALQVVEIDGDPWATAQGLATDIGCELFFNVDGDAVIRDIRNPTSGNVMDEYRFGETSKMSKLSNLLTDDPGFNGVIVQAEAPGLPTYVGAVWDDNPDSPTYRFGPYGERPYVYRSQTIYNQSQADAAAQGLFYTQTGITQQATMECIPNPLAEAGDIHFIQYADLGVDDRYLLESFSMPLGWDSTQSSTYRKRVFS